MPERDANEPMAVPASGGSYREVTLSALLFALLVGVVMNASITYAGLKIGFTIGGSAIAAVLGFGLLRGIGRRFVPGAGSILETNIAQTAASSINIPNSGIIFTVPVLMLLGYTFEFGSADFWLITAACIAGAVLGCAFIVPLRKQMIEIDRLRFPTGTGVAAILKSPGAGAAKTLLLLLGITLSAAIYAPAGLPSIKIGAGLDELDALVADGKVSEADAAQTRQIAEWIEDGQIPGDVIERGRVLARAQASEDFTAYAEEWSRDPAVSDAQGGAVQAMAAMLEQGGPTETDDEVALTAFLVSEDLEDWSALKALKAKKPLFGYEDLDIRLPERTIDVRDENGKVIDSVGDPEMDLDEDGKPDLAVTNSTVDVGRWLGVPAQYQIIFAIAPFALGAGYLSGKAGLIVLSGGVLAFLVLNPLTYALGWTPATTKASEVAGYAFGAFNRPLGIGLLLGGALIGVLASLPAIGAALKSLASSKTKRGGGKREELGIKTLLVAVVLAVGLLFVAADIEGAKPLNTNGLCPVTEQPVNERIEPVEYKGYAITVANSDARTAWTDEWTDDQRDEYLASKDAKPGWLAGMDRHWRALTIALIGAAWIWFAGIIIAQCTGMTDWSPISGMALLTVVLVLMLAGSGNVLMAVLIGAALCVAITLAADMMADLRTGHLVGATPRKQQMVELMTTWLGPIVCMGTLVLIASVNMKSLGVPLGPGTDTAAPQAQALQAVIMGVRGGDMPYALYGLGGALGMLLGLGGFAGLGVLVGLSMYLPFIFIATYGIGCVINILASTVFGKRRAEEYGVPLAAGFIVGESLLALGINIIVLAMG